MNLNKVCNICGEEKSIDSFPKRKLKSGNISCHYACKHCYSVVQKKSRIKHKKKYISQKRKYYLENKDIILERNRKRYKKYYQKNKNERSKKALKRYYENREEILEQKRKNYKADPEKYKKQALKRRKSNLYKKWKERKRKEHREYRREYYKKKRKEPIFRLRKNISKSVNDALKRVDGSKAGESIINYLPYSIEDLKNHLEAQFEPWMNWDNWGAYTGQNRVWHIDHIIPQSKLPYDSMNHPNFKKCWALENLRPLDGLNNIKKSNDISEISL